jgi:hypothetical protein
MLKFRKFLEAEMDIKIWLDDERPMPGNYNTHVKTALEAIELLKQGRVTAISLDHDLGEPEAGSGYDVAKWIEEQAFHQKEQSPNLIVSIHTDNPVGRQNMKYAIQNAERYSGGKISMR